MDLLTPHSHRTIYSANDCFEIMHALENLKYFKNDKLLFWEVLQQNSHNIDSYDFFIVIRRIRFLKKRKKVGKATSFN